MNTLIERGDWKGFVRCCARDAEFIACYQRYSDDPYSGLMYDLRVWQVSEFLKPKNDLGRELANLRNAVRSGFQRPGSMRFDHYANAAPFRELPFLGPGAVGQAASNEFWKIVLDRDLKVQAVYVGAH